jgi:hypothetical protein
MVAPLIQLARPELTQPRNDLGATPYRLNGVDAADIARPLSVQGKTLSEQIASTFVEGPTVSTYPLIYQVRSEVRILERFR